MTSHHPYAAVALGSPHQVGAQVAPGNYQSQQYANVMAPPSPMRAGQAHPGGAMYPPSFTTPPMNLYPHLRPGGAADDGQRSEHSVSSSGASSQQDVLPLCPDDNGCQRVNDRDHQKQYSHTCRLFPCFHAHLKYHTRFFRHAPGQAATTSSEEGSASAKTPSNASTGSLSRTRAAKHRKQARKALTSVSFTHISPDVPNAQKIVVLHASRAFEIAGDWSNVMLHTFKRYLYQVTGVRPPAQMLTMGPKALDDEMATLADLGVTEGSQIIVDVDVTKVAAPSTSVPLAEAASTANPKIPIAWL